MKVDMYNNGQECPVCSKGKLEKKLIDETFEYKGRSLNVPDFIIFKCSYCNEEIVAKESLKRSEKTIRDFHKMVDGLLTSEEMKKGRTALGFTQEAFANVLGVGAKNIARYESGKVTQSKSMDNLIRIIFEYPFTLDVISKEKIVIEPIESIRYSTKPSDKDVIYCFSSFKKMRA